VFNWLKEPRFADAEPPEAGTALPITKSIGSTICSPGVTPTPQRNAHFPAPKQRPHRTDTYR
jgi:hypothetical protein